MNSTLRTAAILSVAIFLGVRAQAANFIWDAGGSGNWTTATNWDLDAGHPDDTGDTATINQTGVGAYTVTVDASKTIGGFTLNSADAAVATGLNTLRNEAAEGATPKVFTHTAGTLDGTYEFVRSDVNLNNVSSATGATFKFVSANILDNDSTIDWGSSNQLAANQALVIDDTGVGVKRHTWVTTANGFTNLGSITLLTTGQHVAGANTDDVKYTVTSGTLLNQGTVSMTSSNGAPINDTAWAILDANLTNDTTGVFTGSNPANGRLVLGSAGGTHENRGSFTVSSGQLFVTGSGTSFTQNGAGASLDVVRFTLGNSDATANTFTINGGTIDGLYEFQKTDVTIASGVTSTTGATFRFVDSSQTTNTSTLTLGDNQIAANQALELINPPAHVQRKITVTTSAAFTNDGRVSLIAAGRGDQTNRDDAELIVGGTGVLTNNGLIEFVTGTSTHTVNSRAFLTGSLANRPGGTVTVTVNTKEGEYAGDAILGATGAAHTNSGAITLQTADRALVVKGTSLTNNSTGTIEGTGRLDVTGLTSGKLVNNGTVSPGLSPGILTVDGDYEQSSTGTLLIEILGNGGVAGTDYDQLIVTGNATLAGTLRIDILGAYEPDLLDSFLIFDAAGITGSFSNLSGTLVDAFRDGGLAGTFTVTVDGDAGTVTLGQFARIPEPASALLMALAGLALLRRRR